ncbi:MAG: phosphoribosylformylglycinamidine cyclo-ligase [Spirochaetia bacterium]|jgi:phosphoribosylformylglycinamidine cyclo-ligase|nr:phosphoribosylformylglycinamidine cyclo-ligase [Spirochaetia bacterium]
MGIKSYAEAGVDIEKGDRFAQFIASLKSKAVSGDIGGFAGGVEIDIAKYKRPVLLSTTDGVGTKLILTRQLGIYDTIGIDLVAMCVNDLIVCGADPLNFLDYIACGKLNPEIMEEIIKGIVKGCEEAECTLAGGETAEMPDVYDKDDYDLAGFCVGIVDKDKMLPKKGEIKKGDKILALPSEGIHSNGLSLARKIISEKDIDSRKELLKPTKIYVKELKKLLTTGVVLSAAHITGGGLESNIKRTIPSDLKAVIDYSSWETPDIFQKIMRDGDIAEAEMRKVFNMGIGIAITVRRGDAEKLASFALREGIAISEIGEIV